MYKYNLTLTGLAVAIFTFSITVVLELNVFEQIVAYLRDFNSYHFDKLIIPLLLFAIFMAVDIHKRHKKAQVENAKKDIYKAMLSSSHHILNTFMYQMDLFKMTAEDTPGFDAKVLAYYEDIIDNTSDQIKSLSNLRTIDEYNIKSSVLAN